MKEVEKIRLTYDVCLESRRRILSKDALLREDRSRWTFDLEVGLFVVVRRHRTSLERMMRSIIVCHEKKWMEFDREVFQVASRRWQESKWIDAVKCGRGAGKTIELEWLEGWDLYCIVLEGDRLMEAVRRWLHSERAGEDVWY